MSGFELQECLIVDNVVLLIIFVMGYGDVLMVVLMMKKGVMDFIEKLFDEVELCKFVEWMFDKV